MRYEREHSIVGDARRLREHPEDFDFAVREPEPERSRELRREFYTLLTAASEAAVDDFIEQSPEFGPLGIHLRAGEGGTLPVLPQHLIYAEDPYRTLEGALFDTNGSVRFLRDKPSFNERLRPLCERIDHIAPALSQATRQPGPAGRYAERLVSQGMATVFSFGTRILETTERLVQAESSGEASAQDIAAVARCSGPVLTKFASLGFDEFTTTNFRLLDKTVPSHDPRFFTLREGREGNQLDIAEPIPVPYKNGEWIGSMLSEQFTHKIGCPAVIRLNGASPIERMWQRMVGIAEQSVWQRGTRST